MPSSSCRTTPHPWFSAAASDPTGSPPAVSGTASTPAGAEFVLVDPAKGARTPAFDHAKLAAALSKAANANYDSAHLPFNEIDLTADIHFVSFNANGHRWRCDTAGSA